MSVLKERARWSALEAAQDAEIASEEMEDMPTPEELLLAGRFYGKPEFASLKDAHEAGRISLLGA